MRFLFDQNISHRILSGLPYLFDGSTSVKGEGLSNAPDIEIWEFAKKPWSGALLPTTPTVQMPGTKQLDRS